MNQLFAYQLVSPMKNKGILSPENDNNNNNTKIKAFTSYRTCFLQQHRSKQGGVSVGRVVSYTAKLIACFSLLTSSGRPAVCHRLPPARLCPVPVSSAHGWFQTRLDLRSAAQYLGYIRARPDVPSPCRPHFLCFMSRMDLQ